ncbi:hypothetical protein ACP3WC_24205 [Salmonella enterica]
MLTLARTEKKMVNQGARAAVKDSVNCLTALEERLAGATMESEWEV